MPAATGLALDVILLAVLGFAMYRGWKLSRQFEQMKADRAAFEKLIQALNLAASRAEGAITALREAVTGSAEQLQAKISTARALSDELEIVVQAGDNLAERLQNLAEKSRQSHARPEPEAPAADAGAQPRTKAEKELLEAVKARQKS